MSRLRRRSALRPTCIRTRRGHAAGRRSATGWLRPSSASGSCPFSFDALLIHVTNLPRHTEEISDLLVHIGRSAWAEDADSELTAAQWAALRFLARANRVSRTPSAFASFQATTRGTASQCLKSLVDKGFLARQRSETDGRSVRFEVTDLGRDHGDRAAGGFFPRGFRPRTGVAYCRPCQSAQRSGIRHLQRLCALHRGPR